MRSRSLVIFFIVSTILLLPVFAHSQAAKPTSLKWGTSSVGGSVYVMSVGMAIFGFSRPGGSSSGVPHCTYGP